MPVSFPPSPTFAGRYLAKLVHADAPQQPLEERLCPSVITNFNKEMSNHWGRASLECRNFTRVDSDPATVLLVTGDDFDRRNQAMSAPLPPPGVQQIKDKLANGALPLTLGVEIRGTSSRVVSVNGVPIRPYTAGTVSRLAEAATEKTSPA